jgi:hypothetical protein
MPCATDKTTTGFERAQLMQRWSKNVLCIALLAATPIASAAEQVFTGRLSLINGKEVVLDSKQSFAFNPRNAVCIDFRGDALTCETLVGIGYADKVNITLVAGVVKRIHILELQQ